MKLHIQARLLCFIFLPCMLGLIGLGVLSGYFAQKGIHDQSSKAMSQLLARQAGELKNMVLLTEDAIKNFAGTQCVGDFLEALAGGGEPSEELKAGVDLVIKTMSASYSTIDQIGIITPEGAVVAHITPRSVGTRRSYFSPNDRPHVINTVSGTKKEFTAVVTMPVRRSGRVIGHVYVTTPMKSLAERTIGTFNLYEHSTLGVYDPKGIALMHSDASRQGKDDSGNVGIRALLAGEGRLQRYEDGTGARHLLYATALPELGWTIILDVPEAEADAPLTTMLRVIASISCLILLVCGGVIVWITRDMARSVRDLTGFAGYVAEGNLAISPQQQSMLDRHACRPDELGSLTRSVEGMARNMADMVQQAKRKTQEAEKAADTARAAGMQAEKASREALESLNARKAVAEQLEQVVSSVSSAVAELSAQILASEQGADEQAHSVNETAAAMEEMNSSVLAIAKNAGETADISEQAKQHGQRGAGIVQQVIDGMERVGKASAVLREDVAALSQKATAIGTIMDVISDIADQTNLLALNAAIEAARAGEAGRGFAVVADEVRKLAEKTMQATGEVGEAVRGIQAGTARNMENMEHSAATVAEVVELAAHSGSALGEIVSLVEQASDQVRNIASASEEQSSTSEEIHRSLDRINRISSETAGAMHRSGQAVRELSRQSDILLDLMHKMRQ